MAGRAIVLQCDDSQIENVIEYCRCAPFLLHCVHMRTKSVLTELGISPKWKDVPLALEVGGLGDLLRFYDMRNSFADLNLRVYLPTRNDAEFAAVRILSSLGVSTAVSISPGTNWECMADLMTYAYLGLAPHAPIEPFACIERSYQMTGYTRFQSVYFNDPERFLYVDADGRAAFTREHLQRDDFFADNFEAVTTLAERDDYQKCIRSWDRHFLETAGCAYCKAFRVCLGTAKGAEESGCSAFFEGVMEIVEQQKLRESTKRALWQP